MNDKVIEVTWEQNYRLVDERIKARLRQEGVEFIVNEDDQVWLVNHAEDYGTLERIFTEEMFPTKH